MSEQDSIADLPDILEESIREAADAMSEEEAWVFIQDLPEEINFTDEWIAMFLAKKWPSIVEKLKAGDE